MSFPDAEGQVLGRDGVDSVTQELKGVGLFWPALPGPQVPTHGDGQAEGSGLGEGLHLKGLLLKVQLGKRRLRR